MTLIGLAAIWWGPPALDVAFGTGFDTELVRSLLPSVVAVVCALRPETTRWLAGETAGRR